MRGLNGRVAIVTGAGGGIGLSTVVRLAEEGARVVCLDLSPTALDEVVCVLRGRGLDATTGVLDVGDEMAVREAVDGVARDHGGVHVLVNAHGVYHQGADGVGPIEADRTVDWELMLNVNLMGVVHMTRSVLPWMKKQRYGRIVTISSAAGVVGGFTCSASYATSKAAVACFMKCAAREGAEFGITANSVAPGQIDTAMTTVVLSRIPLQSIVDRTPLGRLGTPDEVASAIAFLSSDDASFITGQSVGVNGGMIMV